MSDHEFALGLVAFVVGLCVGLSIGREFGFKAGFEKCRLIFRAKVSDECGKEMAQRVFGEKPVGEGSR